MYSKKILFYISLYGAIIIIAIGIWLKFNDISSSGYTYGRYGNVGHSTINGNSALVLGFLILIFSIWNYTELKKYSKERQTRINQELNETVFKKSKNDLKLYLYNRKEFNKKYKIEK